MGELPAKKSRGYYDPGDGIPDIKIEALSGLRVVVKDEGSRGTIFVAYAKPAIRTAVVSVNMDSGGSRTFKYDSLEFETPEIAVNAVRLALEVKK